MLRWLLATPLAVGSKAPDFTLPDQDGNRVTLSELRGKPVVLVFYPGDDTSVCTKQLCDLRDSWHSLQFAGASVFGINPQGMTSHQQFRKKYDLPFPLLVDRGGRVASLFHAGGWLVRRTVYAIDGEGIVRFARRGKPWPQEILAGIT